MGRLNRRLITIIALAAILGACSSRAPEGSLPTPTPPGPPALAEPGNVYPTPPAFSRSPRPVITKAPGAVIRTEFELSQIGEGQRPGLMLIDVTSRKVEQWTLAEGAEDARTGVANGSQLTNDGRFVLLRTWDQRRFAVERATGETWAWSMQGWVEEEVQDEQIIISPQAARDERYTLRWAEQAILNAAPDPVERDWIDWSSSGLGIQYGSAEAGVPNLLITDRAGVAQYRIRNSWAPCNPFSAGSSFWRADSSALMVRVAEGDRLVSLSGEILPLPYGSATHFLPSPADADLIAAFTRTAQQQLVAAYQISTGEEIWSAALPWRYTIDLSVPRWSQSGQYLQFGWMIGGGKGFDCESIELDLPVKVDKAPFPPIQYQVQGTGDCLHLRKEADRTAESLVCLPDGTLLTPIPSPTDTFVSGFPTSERWLHVSAQGKQGWVIGNEGYLGWAP